MQRFLMAIATLAMVFSSPFLLFAREPASELVFPINMRAGQFEDFEGLALVLALQSWQEQPSPLIPFTACRSKLIEYGMAPTYQPSLATKIRLAKDLCASRLVVGECDDQTLTLGIYDLESGTWHKLTHAIESLEGMARWMAEVLALRDAFTEESGIEIHRIWASTYFGNEFETGKRILRRLLDRVSGNHGLCMEYLDLFGDPLQEARDSLDFATWRDIFARSGHYAQALFASRTLLETRNNPNDLAVHGQILLALDRNVEACEYLRKADAYGLVLGEFRQILEACPPSEKMR